MTDARDEEAAGAEHAGCSDHPADADDWSKVPTCTRPMLPRFPSQRHRPTCGGLIRDGVCCECSRPARRV